jgi:integrative and conjugative element protein (TIGR02256 family)
MPPEWLEFGHRNDLFEFYVLISRDSLKTARAECFKNPDRETGGILVGRYSEDRTTAYISGMLPPPLDSRRSRTWFIRGTKGLKELLSRIWKDESTFYLGEWYYHPHSSPQPSLVDGISMRDVADDPNSQCTAPILLILGGDPADNAQPIYMAVYPAQGDALIALSGATLV